MSARARLIMFLVSSVPVGALLVWGLTGLPEFGASQTRYAEIVNARSVPERHSTNAVTPVVFDYRGIDTVGEELILFAAVMGVTLLLRRQREEHERSPRDLADDRSLESTSNPIALVCLGLVAPMIVLGAYVVIHGHISPGGGFQGGVVLATGATLVYLTGNYVAFRALSPVALLDFGESSGAGGFVAAGLIGLFTGHAYLTNTLPLGVSGTILSAGLIPIVNAFVGIAVATGTVFIVFEFLEQTLMIRGARR
jgi:multicomponent Na+:H+ antiporter subunit B